MDNLKSDLVPMFVNLAQDEQVGNVSDHDLFTLSQSFHNLVTFQINFTNITLPIPGYQPRYDVATSDTCIQDSVRLLAVEACVSIASLLQQEDVELLGELR